MEGLYWLRTPKTKLSAQRRCICPGETEGKGKGQRQEIEEEGEGYRNKVKGAGVFVWGGGQ